MLSFFGFYYRFSNRNEAVFALSYLPFHGIIWCYSLSIYVLFANVHTTLLVPTSLPWNIFIRMHQLNVSVMDFLFLLLIRRQVKNYSYMHILPTLFFWRSKGRMKAWCDVKIIRSQTRSLLGTIFKLLHVGGKILLKYFWVGEKLQIKYHHIIRSVISRPDYGINKLLPEQNRKQHSIDLLTLIYILNIFVFSFIKFNYFIPSLS